MQAVVDKAKGTPGALNPLRRIINSSSLEKPLVEKYKERDGEGLVEKHHTWTRLHMIEEMGYDNLVVSILSLPML